MSEIKYILPNFLSLGRNEILIDIYKHHKEITREDTSIYSFYGAFPRSIWNGGRAVEWQNKCTISFMKKVRDFYNKRGIVITFTFTNSELKEEHLDDEYCNTIMEIFDNGMNEVLVASDLLENYIRNNYPKYKINRSITAATINNPYDTSKYYLSVIDKHLNHDLEHLKNIKEKDRIEILCDEICVNNCKFTKEHYKEISMVQLGKISNNPNYGVCRYFSKIPKYEFIKRRNELSNFYISPEEVKNVYVPMGYKYFKLSGRDKYNMIGFESIINYLIKPEYQMDVRAYILERMFLEDRKEKSFYLNYDSMYAKSVEDSGWKYV